MGRKPVHLEMVGGKSPRQRIWLAIRELAAGFTVYSIGKHVVKAKKIEESVIHTYVRSLEKAGYIENITTPDATPIGSAHKWKLVRDNGIEAPRLKSDGTSVTAGLGTEAMWRSLRIIGEFNAIELAASASAGDEEVSPETAKAYLRFLHLAKYVDIVKPARAVGGKRGAIAARYRLNPGKYTGPRPPMIQRTKSVYDPNLGKIVWQEEANHDAY